MSVLSYVCVCSVSYVWDGGLKENGPHRHTAPLGGVALLKYVWSWRKHITGGASFAQVSLNVADSLLKLPAIQM